MVKRIKKPPVRPEKRQDWLKRHEQGESIPDISKRDGFDARTVRRHIEEAKQEREVRDARSTVLRSALERHYADLCELAERLNPPASGQTAGGSPNDERLKAALRQHLPRSPIWGYLNQKDSLNQLKEEAASKVEEVRSDPRLSQFGARLSAVTAGIIAALNFQIEHWAREGSGIILNENLVEEPAGEEGFVNLRYGFAHMDKVQKEEIPSIREVIQDWESRIKQWEEYQKLEKSFADLGRVEKNLSDELAVITLRRIVPGRCRYCPI